MKQYVGIEANLFSRADGRLSAHFRPRHTCSVINAKSSCTTKYHSKMKSRPRPGGLIQLHVVDAPHAVVTHAA